MPDPDNFYKRKLAAGECMAPSCDSPWIESWLCPICGRAYNLCGRHLNTQVHLVTLHKAYHDSLARPAYQRIPAPEEKKDMTDLSKHQPVPGDVVFYCIHMLNDDRTAYHCTAGSHWFGCNVPFRAPNGDTGIAKWYNCCNACYLNLDGNPMNLFNPNKTPLGGHLVWKHDTPFIGDSSS